MNSGTTPALFIRGIGAAVLGLALVTAPLSAQQMPQQQQQQQQMPPEMQEMVEEFQEKQQRLQALSQQALSENPELMEAQVALEEKVEEAMRAIEPETDQLIERLQAMQAEAQAAQEAEDMERLQGLMTEAQSMNERLQVAQTQALEQDEIQQAIEEFQDDMMDEMLAIDPEAEELQERVEELGAQLQAAGPPM